MINFLHKILYNYPIEELHPYHENIEDCSLYANAFTIYHLIYAVLIVGAIIGAAIGLHYASDKIKKRVLDILPIVVIGLYILDLFIRPIAQLEGDFDQSIHSYLDKLPFHICTSMGVVCVFAQHSKWLQKFKGPFVILAIVGPLMYLTYPSGVFQGNHPFCYNTIQTMVFHGVLMAWGVLNITTGMTKVSIKNWYKTLAIQGALFSWALLGNIVFSDMTNAQTWWETGYDWFFMKSGAFYIACGELWYSIIAPIGVFVAIYLVALGVYGCAHLGYFIASRVKKAKEAKKAKA